MKTAKAIYPMQCRCGHIFLEKYQFKEVTKDGYIGFCWCGFCKTKHMVKPYPSEPETPLSLEDLAAEVIAGEPTECLCVEFAHLILQQAKEIEILKMRLENMEAEKILDGFDIEKMDKAIESINYWTNRIRRIDNVGTISSISKQ